MEPTTYGGIFSLMSNLLHMFHPFRKSNEAGQIFLSHFCFFSSSSSKGGENWTRTGFNHNPPPPSNHPFDCSRNKNWLQEKQPQQNKNSSNDGDDINNDDDDDDDINNDSKDDNKDVSGKDDNYTVDNSNVAGDNNKDYNDDNSNDDDNNNLNTLFAQFQVHKVPGNEFSGTMS